MCTECDTVELNEDQLRQTLDFITDRPERHQQATWTSTRVRVQDLAAEGWQCNTTGCLAGWAALRNGWLPAPATEWNPELQRWTLAPDGYLYDAAVVPADQLLDLLAGRTDRVPDEVAVQQVAREILGLTEPRARALFYSENTLEQLWTYANRWSEGRIEIPHDRIAAYHRVRLEKGIDYGPDYEDASDHEG